MLTLQMRFARSSAGTAPRVRVPVALHPARLSRRERHAGDVLPALSPDQAQSEHLRDRAQNEPTRAAHFCLLPSAFCLLYWRSPMLDEVRLLEAQLKQILYGAVEHVQA